MLEYFVIVLLWPVIFVALAVVCLLILAVDIIRRS